MAAATIIFTAIWATPEPAQAQQITSPSRGCTSANAGAFDFLDTSGSDVTRPVSIMGVFAQNEVLQFTFTLIEGESTIDLMHVQSGDTVLNGSATIANSFTIPASGTNSFTGTYFLKAETRVRLTVRCTQTTTTTTDQSSDRIKSFMHRRADLLLEEEPDRPRLLRRSPNSLWDQGSGAGFAGGAATPFNLALSGDGAAHKLTFSTSLRQMARAAAADAQRRHRTAQGHRAMALGYKGGSAPSARPYDGIDVWVEGHYSGFEDDTAQGDREGHLGVLYVGADQLLAPWLLVGALAQFDWSEDESTVLGSNVEGNGWMAGPYVSVRLNQGLFFDARGAWGESDNDLDVIGVSTGSFDTERWLAMARLTGNMQRGNFRVTPSVSVKYIEEDQESFTDSRGVFVAGQKLSLGRLKFGPEFGYRRRAADGTIIEPHASIKGIWDFDEVGPITNTAAGIVASPGDLRAKVEGGVLLLRENGVSLRATAAYDGIGDDDFSAYSGKLWLNLPLN